MRFLPMSLLCLLAACSSSGLEGADLKGADHGFNDLSRGGPDLSGADLSGADLSGADLSGGACAAAGGFCMGIESDCQFAGLGGNINGPQGDCSYVCCVPAAACTFHSSSGQSCAQTDDGQNCTLNGDISCNCQEQKWSCGEE
jgi:uncharacterized protein YjbI with pentapeptide repeats